MTNSNSLLTTTLLNRNISEENIRLIVSLVENTCAERSFDVERVSDELARIIIETPDIRSMSSFARAVLSRLDVSKFKKDAKNIDFLGLHLSFKRNGFVGELWEKFLIDYIEQMCVENYGISAESLIWTNREIMKYCIKNELRTLAYFKGLLLRSQLLKNRDVPVKELTIKAKKEAEECDKIWHELKEEGEEDLYGEDKNYRAFSEEGIIR